MIIRIFYIVILLISVASSKFIRDSSNKFVFDTTTTLVWQDNNDVTFYTYIWLDAINYCENLSFGGFSDWRVPNINELNTIVDDTRVSPAVDTTFVNTASGGYWSSTTYSDKNSEAWNINFADSSSSNIAKTNLKYVRCVRNLN